MYECAYGWNVIVDALRAGLVKIHRHREPVGWKDAPKERESGKSVVQHNLRRDSDHLLSKEKQKQHKVSFKARSKSKLHTAQLHASEKINGGRRRRNK